MSIYQKYKLVLFGLVLSFSLQGQYLQHVKDNAGKYAAKFSLVFLSGAADGLNEILTHKYYAFEAKFPKANAQFWNPELSWRNKYLNDGRGTREEKFFLSKSVLVFTTDAYHLTRTIDRTAIFAALSIDVCGVGNKPFLWYLYDFFLYSVIRSAGFKIVYSSF